MKAWMIATLGLLTCGWGPRDEAQLPFELSRVEESRMGWNAGPSTWWEYTAKYHGKKLSFTAPKHDRWGDTDSPETFTQCNEGYALGKHQLFDGGKKQRISAEALLVNMGPDPSNSPRWFLLKERAGHLEATWLASPGGATDPVWQVWAPGQKQQVPKGEHDVWQTRASLGVLPLRSYLVKMALSETNAPRFLTVDCGVLLDVASLELFRLPELQRGERRIDPLGLSPDGNVLLFNSIKGEASGIEQVAWKTGESRWLPLDWKKRHLRNMEDATPAWMVVALAWKPEKEGGLRWAEWREGATYPILTGRLSGSYTLEGYRAEILEPLLKLLAKECGAVITMERPAYPLDPGEVWHQVILDGETLSIGFTKSHGVSVFSANFRNEGHAQQVIARVAELVDKTLRAGKWQEFSDL